MWDRKIVRFYDPNHNFDNHVHGKCVKINRIIQSLYLIAINKGLSNFIKKLKSKVMDEKMILLWS